MAEAVTLVSPRGVTIEVHPSQVASLGPGFCTPDEAKAKADKPKATKATRAKAPASPSDETSDLIG